MRGSMLRFLAPIRVHQQVGTLELSLNRPRNPLEMKEGFQFGSWPQLTSEIRRCSLSLNPPSRRGGQAFTPQEGPRPRLRG